jgi:two-component system, chemotaxis family, CheB/CheR fusion protein
MKTASLRILVVDDNAENARMLKVLLKGEGHEVRIAFDGPEAIEAVKLYKPDVVLLDLALLGMSGVDVATELRRITELSACLLVAVSGYGEESLPSPSPFDRHFQKPVNLAALLEYLSGLRAGQTPPCPSMAVA